jgi:hypothetical protein
MTPATPSACARPWPRCRLLLLALAALLAPSCLPRPQTMPDARIPHRLAAPATVTILVRQADGRYLPHRVQAQAGWWLASPLVIEDPLP